MRTITTHTDAYKFEELTDDAKRNAIENLHNINVDFGWWDCMYEDAKMIGCAIKGFDIVRGSYCKLVCSDAHETANLIIANHGETCDTYKLAAEYLKDRDKVIDEAERDENGELANGYAVDKLLGELETEFKRALGEEYLSLLRKEYEYLTSEDAIVETILANEYEFTKGGKLI